MKNNSSKNAKATICSGNICATVYGDAARIITAIVVTVVALIAINQIAKAIN